LFVCLFCFLFCFFFCFFVCLFVLFCCFVIHVRVSPASVCLWIARVYVCVGAMDCNRSMLSPMQFCTPSMTRPTVTTNDTPAKPYDVMCYKRC
jgi:hypothetical protein